MANLYEIITVIHPNETDEGVQAIIGGLRKRLTDSGGTVHAVDLWGRRKLAYEIGNNDEGIYVLFHVEGPANVPADFRGYTRIRDSVLRELVVRLEGLQAEVVRKQLEEKGPEDEEQATAQIAAAEARAAEKRAQAAAAVAGRAAAAADAAEEADEEADEEAADESVEAAPESVDESPEADADDKPVGDEDELGTDEDLDQHTDEDSDQEG